MIFKKRLRENEEKRKKVLNLNLIPHHFKLFSDYYLYSTLSCFALFYEINFLKCHEDGEEEDEEEYIGWDTC